MANRKNHPGSIEKLPSGSYRIRLSVYGKVLRYTLPPGRTRVQAEREARRRYDQAIGRAEAGYADAVPFRELLDRFREFKMPDVSAGTRRTYEYSLAAFETFFGERLGDRTVDQIRPAHIRQFLAWRRVHSPDGAKRSTPLAPRSVAKDRAVLHAVFALAQELELHPGNPVTVVTAPKGDVRQPVILTGEEYERLLDACGDRPMLSTFVLLLGESGLRCESEALWLKWDDLKFADGPGWIEVVSERKGHRTKSGRSRWVPMTPRLRERLRDHAAAFQLRTYGGRRAPWVFHHYVSRRRAEAGERIGSMRRGFEAAAERAEPPKKLNQHGSPAPEGYDVAGGRETGSCGAHGAGSRGPEDDDALFAHGEGRHGGAGEGRER